MEENHCVVLKSRPGANGVTADSHFDFKPCSYPSAELKPGEIVIRAEYLSMDPAMRCTLNEDTGVHYIKPQEIDEVIVGLTGIGRVIKSAHDGVKEGDRILGAFGFLWQRFFVVDFNAKLKEGWIKIDPSVHGTDPVVHVMSLCALTSLVGLWEKGHIEKDKNQTLVVSGAAGACGSLAGQMGKLLGCSRVVGICGTEEKCKWIINDLGFDAAVNYKTDDVPSKLKEVCPNGVQVYFDNVGGTISDSVIAEMTQDSHIILCGQISQYNSDVPYPPPIPEKTQATLQERNIARFDEANQQFAMWVAQGKIKVHATITDGLEKAGSAFVSMMNGGNMGKQLVRVL